MDDFHSPHRTRSLVQEAWVRRLSADLVGTKELARVLCQNLGIRMLRGGAMFKFPAEMEQQEAVLSTLCLVASIHRAEGRLEVSKTWIEEIEKYCMENSVALPFEYYFQKAANTYFEGDYSKAMDNFLLSRAHARTSEEKLAVLANLAFCLENLGLPFQNTLQEFWTLLHSLPVIPPYFVDALSQVRSMEMRQAWREGKVADCFKVFIPPQTGMATYYRIWLNLLPYHRFHNSLSSAEMESFLTANPFFMRRAYRLRTLQGILHVEEDRQPSPKEWSDRLYLWVWRWMTDCRKQPFNLIASLLGLLKENSFLHRFTNEDLALVRNATSWIGLFGGVTWNEMSRTVKRFVRPGFDYPLFDLEYQLIEACYAYRDGEKEKWESLRRKLLEQPIIANTDLHWQAFLNGLDEKKPAETFLAPLILEIQKLYKPERSDQLGVDIEKNEISVQGKKTLSEALCFGLDLLHRKNNVTAEEFLTSTYGIRRYDPLIHNPKIFNLLARIRALQIKGLDVGFKAGRVFAIGSWDSVVFYSVHELSYSVINSESWVDFLKGAVSEPPSKVGKKHWEPKSVALLAKDHDFITRELVEKMTGASRATATRLLNQCVKLGLLGKKGNAKRTHYIFKSID